MPNWILFLATLATRLPFIWVGYGVHSDGWRVVRTVAILLAGEEYVTSRPPGYPLPEAILAGVTAVLGNSPAVVNLVSAVYSAVAAVAFRACLEDARVPSAAWIALLTFSFPVLLIESTGAKEHICALMFMLLSYRALLADRMALGGVLLGLAVASRPPTALFGASALAWLAVLHAPAWRATLRRSLVYSASAIVTALIAFLPLLVKYGASLTAVVQTHPGLIRVAYAASLGTFGLVGTVAMASLTTLALWSLGRQAIAPGGSAGGVGRLGDRRRRAHAAFAALNIAAVAATYLALPNEGAYLIPAIPSLVMLIALAAPSRVVLTGCALAASSSLLLSAYQREGEVIVDVAGSAIVDRIERERIDCTARAAGAFAGGLGENDYLIAAHRLHVVRRFTPQPWRLHVIDTVVAREGNHFRLGLNSSAATTPASERVENPPADARFFVLDEMAVYQPQVESLTTIPVAIAAQCPVPRTALLRLSFDLRRRAQ